MKAPPNTAFPFIATSSSLRRQENINGRLRSLVASSWANFGIQYNSINIILVLDILRTTKIFSGNIKWTELTNYYLQLIFFAGMIFGMFGMGLLGDIIGRNKALSYASLLMVFSSVGTAIGPWGTSSQAFIIISVFRFLLGIGSGGCYPLSAVISAEGSCSMNILKRNKRTGFVFIFQSFGAIVPYLVAVGINNISADIKFRLTFGLGAIPPTIVYFCVRNEKESSEFMQVQDKAGLMFEQENSFWGPLRFGLLDPLFWHKMVGTAFCWLIYDFTTYNNNQITQKMAEHMPLFGTWCQPLTLLMGIPAIVIAIWCLKYIGTKKLQVYGFLLIGSVCFLIASSWKFLTPKHSTTLTESIMLIVYMLFQFALNWGPYVTTFILPQEIYAAEVRSTFNGIASAGGKFGAVIATCFFPASRGIITPIQLLIAMGIINVLGAIISQCVISNNLWEIQKNQRIKYLSMTDSGDVSRSSKEHESINDENCFIVETEVLLAKKAWWTKGALANQPRN